MWKRFYLDEFAAKKLFIDHDERETEIPTNRKFTKSLRIVHEINDPIGSTFSQSSSY